MKRKGDEDELSFARQQQTTRDEYVGRAGDDESGDADETGAERRAEAEAERVERHPSSQR